ncbi:MAG: response regulator [Bryobacterales bacterium]|nr:response regulator [Bryobacterales bacterium]
MQPTTDARKQILIVEDEGLIAADIQRRLERLGYSVPAIARSGEEALDWARSRKFDLVLMDIRLNGEMDGIAAAQALKVEFETPVVYITAHADQETINRAKLTEPFGYILKPIGEAELRSTVQISLYKHEMERRLRASEAWLSATLRSVGEGLIATDTEGEIVFMNPVAEHLTGWSNADAHGRPLMDVLRLVEESTRATAKNPIVDLFPEESRPYSLVATKSGAEAVVEVGCFENLSAVDRLGWILVVRDIRARREMERRLMQSQRMEAIANLAGGLAHDFNNQLTVMLGYATELGAGLSGPERQQALEIQHAASIASSITGQLLTLSRREVVRFEVLNVNDVICEMQSLISRSLGKYCTLVTALGSPNGFVRADRTQLKQVLLNLALNARDAMAEGGELRIETSTIQITNESPASRLYRPGVYVWLRVLDSGEGMDQETLSRIFEPFFTTKKPGFGTGLGLSIVHSIIVQSGGYISASSEIGQGTSFVILLPCVGTLNGLSEVPESKAVSNGGDRPTTVLLVDDEDGVRRLMRCYLEREGYRVLEARTGEDAERHAQEYPQAIDILIADVAMPGMTGPQLAKRLSAARPDMKVLYVSGYQHDMLDPDALSSPDVGHLSKPFAAAELLARVRALLGAQAASCSDPGITADDRAA